MPDGGVSVVDDEGVPISEKTVKISEVIFFVCADGFNLNGPNEAVCGDDGSLSVAPEDVPVCDGEFERGHSKKFQEN